MKVDARRDASVIRLLGDHDLSTVPEITRAIEAARVDARRAVIDLTDATFVDSALLAALVRVREFLVAVVPPGSIACRRIAGLGLSSMFCTAETLDDAVSTRSNLSGG